MPAVRVGYLKIKTRDAGGLSYHFGEANPGATKFQSTGQQQVHDTVKHRDADEVAKGICERGREI
jgi:hypothetical protein